MFAGPEVRLCLFIDMVLVPTLPLPPPAACVTLTREVLVDDAPPLEVLDSSEFDCERGRVVDDAILGSAAPLRDPLLGLPEARFLVEA